MTVTLATYQALMQRFSSNADLQWRTPALVLTVEAFAFAGIYALRDSPAVLGPGLIGLYVGVAGALSMRRIRMLALVDRQALDLCEYWFEQQGLLPHGWPVGIHRLKVSNRIAQLNVSKKGLPLPNESSAGASVLSAVEDIANADWDHTAETGKDGPSAGIGEFVDRFVIHHGAPSLTWLFVLLLVGLTAFGTAVVEALA